MRKTILLLVLLFSLAFVSADINMAGGANVTVSNISIGFASYINDQDLTTDWQPAASTEPYWIEIEMNQSFYIRSIEVWGYDGGGAWDSYPISYNVSISEDGSSFSLVDSVTGISPSCVVACSEAMGNSTSINQMARYVTINLTSWEGTHPEVSEVIVYGREEGFEVELDYPADSASLSSSTITFNGTLLPSSTINITNATIYIWDSDDEVFNSTTNIVTGSDDNTTEFSISGFGSLVNYNWNILGCGENATDTICEFADANHSLSIAAETDATYYGKSVYETSEQTLSINVTVPSGADLYSSTLVYNLTNYPATVITINSTSYRITKSLDIPFVSTNSTKTFYWSFIYLNDDGTITQQNSSTYEQNVSDTHFVNCDGIYTNVAVNYTIYNETSREKVNVTFKSSFDWYLGTGTEVENYSFYNYSELNSSFMFCISPSTETYVTSAIISLKKATFNDRTYDFNLVNYTNSPKSTRLFMLDGGTNVIVQVQDSSSSPLEDYFVDIYRYYPETDDYEIVERKRTDEYGQFVARLIENTVKYKFVFKNSKNEIKKVTGDMTIACRATICILPFVIEDDVEEFERFEEIEGYESNVTFNNNTNIFYFTWNDVTGKSVRNRLLVTRHLWNGTTNVCNLTSTATAGSLSCSVGDISATYYAQTFRRVVGEEEVRVGYLTTIVGVEHEIFGREGLMWSFFLLMTMLAIGYYRPVGGVVFYLAGLFALWAFHIIYLNPALFIAQLVIGVIFIWAFSKT